MTTFDEVENLRGEASIGFEEAAQCQEQRQPQCQQQRQQERQQQRQQEIAQLFRTHEDFLRWLAVRLCRSSFDPEDLLQDVFERTIRHFHSLSSNHRAWMARVMRNLFIDRVRRRAACPVPTVLDEEFPAPVEIVPAWREALDADDLQARLHELPDKLREPLELFTFEGCSYEEIARSLGISTTTVGTRILRARHRLKQNILDSHPSRGVHGSPRAHGPGTRRRAARIPRVSAATTRPSG